MSEFAQYMASLPRNIAADVAGLILTLPLAKSREESTDISSDNGDVSITIGDVTFNIDFDIAYLLFKKNVHFFMGKKNETLEETCKRVIDIHGEC